MYLDYDNLISIIPEKELINLTNDMFPAENVNQDIVNNCAEFAEELINAAVRKRYALPLTFVPFIIKNLSCDITAYRIYSRRPNKIPEAIKDNYEKALKLLDKISSGSLNLDMPTEHPGEEINISSPAIRVNKTQKDRAFTDAEWSNFRC